MKEYTEFARRAAGDERQEVIIEQDKRSCHRSISSRQIGKRPSHIGPASQRASTLGDPPPSRLVYCVLLCTSDTRGTKYLCARASRRIPGSPLISD